MKSFGQYILENMGDDLATPDTTALATTEPSSDSITAACSVAASVAKPELLQFLRDLANKHSEIKDALAGNSPSTDTSEPDDISPPSPDSGGSSSEINP